MDFKGPSCLFHYAAGGASQLGIQKLHSSFTNKSIPELLAHKADGVPITDDKMQRRLERGHPYVSNLGGGNYFGNYEEAVNALMHRDLEEIEKDEHKEVIFIPENYVPHMPRAVKTVKEFEDQQRGLNDKAKALGIKGGQAGSQLLKNVVGDHTEWGLCDELET